MKCVKCDRESTYDVPTNLCDEHWVDWMMEGYDEFLSSKTIEKEKQNMLDRMWEKYGKPKDW